MDSVAVFTAYCILYNVLGGGAGGGCWGTGPVADCHFGLDKKHSKWIKETMCFTCKRQKKTTTSKTTNLRDQVQAKQS